MLLTPREWIYHLDRFEISLRFKMARERNRFIKVVAKGYENTRVISNYAIAEHRKKVNDLLVAHYSIVAPFFAKNAVKKQKKSSFQAFIAEWIATEALQKANMISKTNYSDIFSIIEGGLIEGESIPAIVKLIRGATALTPSRATVIARTETHNAATYAALESVREVERETGATFQKKWIVTLDSRARDAHAAMANSDWIDTDELFYVNGEHIDRAGQGSAANSINCRCQIIFREK